MRTHIYREQDYTFGQAMLSLRTVMELTQVELASLLGISRGAVLGWEAGSTYPKAEHLKRFIALAVQKRAFVAIRVEEEIRALWQAAHQKVLVDEPWLSTLLLECLTPYPSGALRSAPRRQVDWDEAPDVSSFYGREPELATLEQWVVQERCRVVSVLGMGGIGKSCLSVTFMHRAAEHFEVVLFCSLRDAHSCEAWLADCLQVLSSQPPGSVPDSFQQRLRLFLECLHERRVLLVMDNLEALVQEGEREWRYRPGYAGYGHVLRRLGETAHQSCLLLTCREKPAELVPLEGTRSRVRTFHLAGLDVIAGTRLLAEKEVTGTPEELSRLIEAYSGNPLALKIAAETITDLFDSSIGSFLKHGTAIFGGIQELLAGQINRLTDPEQSILRWLAIAREPLTFDELLSLLVLPLPQGQVLAALNNLRRRSLIERGKLPGSVTLPALVLEYVTGVFIEEATSEIEQKQLSRLLEHGITLAGASEEVRQTQKRIIVDPILARLHMAYPRRNEVEKHLLFLLAWLRERSGAAQGYGPANLIALLHELRGHLHELNLSQLTLRGAYLQGIEMQDASLAGATLHDTLFTEAFDATWAVAISSNGQYWAAGSSSGGIRVWREAGKILQLLWQIDTAAVSALTFSPNGHTLAIGNWDGGITLWELERNAPLWSGWHIDGIPGLAFSPDGHILASAGNDANILLWDAYDGTLLETLPHACPVFSVAWSPDGRLLACGGSDGHIQLWQIQATQSSTCIALLEGHTQGVRGLAFAPDGTQLASASRDRTVRLWNVQSGRCLYTLEGHTDQVKEVTWSPDGHIVASCGFDKMIWLWNIEECRYQAVLQGHTARVYGIAFTPDSHRLLSGSEDGTLRVWDVARRQCVRIVQGHASCLYDVTWSPDSTQLASAGSDGLVTIWQVTGGTPPRLLRGHSWGVYGVAWSSNGKTLASSGWDNAIRLWDSSSGTCIEVLQDSMHSDSTFWGLAWSPDGRWLAGGNYLHGVHLWDIAKHTQQWERLYPTGTRRIAWNPDGTRLACCCGNESVYILNASDGALVHRLQWHQSMVASAVWSPDGSMLASGGGSNGCGEILLWDTRSGKCLHTLTGSSGSVVAVDWSPGGELLISGSSNGTLRWWDVESRECVKICQGHQGVIQSLRISPDGLRLASCGDDGAINIWDLADGELLLTLRRDRPYERLNITGVRGLSKAQKATLRLLGAIEETEHSH